MYEKSDFKSIKSMKSKDYSALRVVCDGSCEAEVHGRVPWAPWEVEMRTLMLSHQGLCEDETASLIKRIKTSPIESAQYLLATITSSERRIQC